MRGAEDQIAGTPKIARDISDRKQAAQELAPEALGTRVLCLGNPRVRCIDAKSGRQCNQVILFLNEDAA